MTRKELEQIGKKLNLNCGGEGSGKPGPCPTGSKIDKIKASLDTLSHQRDLMGMSSPEERLTKWDGFGPIAGQQIQAYQDMLNRGRYKYLSPHEIASLQVSGHLSTHKQPKITDLGREAMKAVNQAEYEDIQDELKSVGLDSSGRRRI